MSLRCTHFGQSLKPVYYWCNPNSILNPLEKTQMGLSKAMLICSQNSVSIQDVLMIIITIYFRHPVQKVIFSKWTVAYSLLFTNQVVLLYCDDMLKSWNRLVLISEHLLFVCNDINAGIIECGRFGEERSYDGHCRRNFLWVSKGRPQTHNRIWRPCHQEHYNHHNRHL